MIAYYRLMGVRIGKSCYMSLKAHIDVRRGEIIIGNNVNISGGCYILGHTGYQAIKPGEKTVIEDNVIIFVNAVILPGVRVGKNSIIGAGAIVMRDMPPNVVVQGNPARVIQHLENKD
jgi:acetyltransferase-like isoleucine patch superfamily enzyme